MKQLFLIFLAVLFCFPINSFGQIPTGTLVQIVKAEDERRFDKTLENLAASPNERVRIRAALAVGRIGDEDGIPLLTDLLEKDRSNAVRSMALFALGEIESSKAAPVISEVLNNRNHHFEMHARALEAAGKIAAANPKDEKTKELGQAILRTLETENEKRQAPNRQVIMQGLTAVLRARPADGEKTVAKFLEYADVWIRADALNTLARLRAKNVNEKSREFLQKDPHELIRANAARVLGAAEDKDSLNALLKAATTDADSRVRVSAIRSLASLKDAMVADALVKRGEKLLQDYASSKTTYVYPNEKNEILEIAATLGRLLQNTDHPPATRFLTAFGKIENHHSPEVEIALARVSPKNFVIFQRQKGDRTKSWQAISATFQGISELAKAPDSPEINAVKEQARSQTADYIEKSLNANPATDKALSDALSAYAAYKHTNLPQTLRKSLQHRDPVVRATTAGLLADASPDKESFKALKTAFDKAYLSDLVLNDAQLAILDALFKLDKKESVPSLVIAANSRDYLVRKKAFELMRDKELSEFGLVKTTFEKAAAQKKNQLSPYSHGSKLGVITNTNADYVRAVSRKSARAVIATDKGAFTIEFFPEAAPLTVDNFIKLAKSNYFNNVMIHRVVPNFVMQDGDPRGDGNGGPGWEIRCEINQIRYERGMVGMALSGKDTGGSQWFVTHSPQPHLDGGYTVFGKVNEADMKIVDNLVRGDNILSVKIIEGNMRRKATKKN